MEQSDECEYSTESAYSDEELEPTIIVTDEMFNLTKSVSGFSDHFEEPAPEPPMPAEDSEARTVSAGRGPRGHLWCFTMNGVEPNSLRPTDVEVLAAGIDWLVYQDEEGAQGNYHWQGAVRMNKQVFMNTLKKIGFLNGAHWERMRGKPSQAVTYCTKVESRKAGPFYLPGTKEQVMLKVGRSGQGKRSDLYEVTDMVIEGLPMRDIALANPVQFVKFHKGLERLRQVAGDPTPHRDGLTPIDTAWIWGPPGTGKTFFVRERWPPSETVYWANEGKWFPGLTEKHTTIVFNDLKSSWYTLSRFKRLIDNGPFIGEIKGAHVKMMATTFVVTSNIHPSEMYNNTDECAPDTWEWDPDAEGCSNPLWRRFPHIYYFDEVWVDPKPQVRRFDESRAVMQQRKRAREQQYGQPQ